MGEFHSDIAIVGSGVAGLWSAKELIDEGLSVTVIEKSETLADGATTRNEGWLHAGTYHSVAIESEEEVMPVTRKTRWSHEAILDFAPEVVDHGTSFALTLSSEMANLAVERWVQAGVGFQEVDLDHLTDAPALNTRGVTAAFRVDDKSINSRLLCEKLARYVSERGGRFLTGAQFLPDSDQTAGVLQGGELHRIVSDRFLITAGVGTKEIVERVTDQELPMRFFKAHLLVVPRLTTDNYFFLEASEVGVMNHGRASVVGINRDGIELAAPDRIPVTEKVQLIYAATTRLLPNIMRYGIDCDELMVVTCNKPDVTGEFGSTQSLDINIFEPAPNYVCALPGKMTMAPYMAKRVASVLLAGNTNSSVPLPRKSVDVTLRPADQWMQRKAHVPDIEGGV